MAILLFSSAYFVFRQQILQLFQPADRVLMSAYFAWLPLFTALILYLTLLEQYLGSQMKVAAAAFMREILLRVLNIVLILAYSLGYINFKGLIAGTILLYLVPVLIIWAICRKTKDFSFSVRFSAFSKGEYKEMAHFAWFHYLLSISITLMTALDANLLPIYDRDGFNSLAVYAVAAYLISFLQMPLKAFLPATFSVLTKAFTDNDMPKAKDFFKRSSINLLIPTLAIALILCCNLGNAVAIIGNQKNYAGMADVVLILTLGQLINISTGMNDQILSITNYYKFSFYVSVFISVVLYVLLRVLIPQYGIYGAAWSNTITLVLFNAVKLVFIHRKLGMLPFSMRTLRVVVAALPALAAGYLLPRLFDAMANVYIGAMADAALRSLAIVLVYVAMLLWLKPSADLDEYLATVRKNKRLF
jgi:O-antigen/teichoic acid export membrane protein